MWEVAMWIDDLGSANDPAAELAADGVVSRAQMDAATVADLRLSGSSDAEVFGAAVASSRAVLTENVGDFVRIAAEHSTAGGHHHGVLIALSSRFSRRPAGIQPLIAAIEAVESDHLDDRVVHLQRRTDE